MGIEGIALGIAGELIYSPPAMLYSSYEVLYNCYTIENNATYNANLALKAGKVTSESSGFVVR